MARDSANSSHGSASIRKHHSAELCGESRVGGQFSVVSKRRCLETTANLELLQDVKSFLAEITKKSTMYDIAGLGYLLFKTKYIE